MSKNYKMRLIKLDKAYGEMIWFVPKKEMAKRINQKKKHSLEEDNSYDSKNNVEGEGN